MPKRMESDSSNRRLSWPQPVAGVLIFVITSLALIAVYPDVNRWVQEHGAIVGGVSLVPFGFALLRRRSRERRSFFLFCGFFIASALLVGPLFLVFLPPALGIIVAGGLIEDVLAADAYKRLSIRFLGRPTFVQWMLQQDDRITVGDALDRYIEYYCFVGQVVTEERPLLIQRMKAQLLDEYLEFLGDDAGSEFRELVWRYRTSQAMMEWERKFRTHATELPPTNRLDLEGQPSGIDEAGAKRASTPTHLAARNVRLPWIVFVLVIAAAVVLLFPWSRIQNRTGREATGWVRGDLDSAAVVIRVPENTDRSLIWIQCSNDITSVYLYWFRRSTIDNAGIVMTIDREPLPRADWQPGRDDSWIKYPNNPIRLIKRLVQSDTLLVETESTDKTMHAQLVFVLAGLEEKVEAIRDKCHW